MAVRAHRMGWPKFSIVTSTQQGHDAAMKARKSPHPEALLPLCSSWWLYFHVQHRSSKPEHWRGPLLGSGPRYMICVTLFFKKHVLLLHGRRWPCVF